MINLKNIVVLGSTGSIGTQALDVIGKCGMRALALTANRSVDLLEKQIRQYKPEYVAVADESAAADLKARTKDVDYTLLTGIEGVCYCASLEKADIVLNSVVGIAGLRPTLAAIDAGKTLALANKESLVTGGDLVMKRAAEKGV